VKINHDFKGYEILLFGFQNDFGDIVSTLRGEKKNYIVRKKRRILGIWYPATAVYFNKVDSFLATHFAGNLSSIGNDQLLYSLKVHPDYNFVDNNTAKTREEYLDFSIALRRFLTKKGRYLDKVQDIDLTFNPLFRTMVDFPKNITRGDYTIETYLIDDGQLKSSQIIPIKVRKIGLDAFIYDMSTKHRVLYGILCVTIAILFGVISNKRMLKVLREKYKDGHHEYTYYI
jgi:uncharacterized protein (TIGR02186 family)